jgi:hypothetical protein
LRVSADLLVTPAPDAADDGAGAIFGGGAGDPTVASPDVDPLDGWTQVWSAPTGDKQNKETSKTTGRSVIPVLLIVGVDI